MTTACLARVEILAACGDKPAPPPPPTPLLPPAFTPPPPPPAGRLPVLGQSPFPFLAQVTPESDWDVVCILIYVPVLLKIPRALLAE